MMKILVLMSTFNGQKYLELQLNSIKNQENVEVYCLVRDDGSSDSTLSILKDFQKKWKNLNYYTGKNIGTAFSYFDLMNKAKIEYEFIEYFAFSDQDDYWKPNKIMAALQFFDKQSQPILYCSNLTLVDESLKNIGPMYRHEIEGISKKSILVERMGTGCTMVFNSAALNHLLKFQTTKKILHDRWFILTMLFCNQQIIFDNNSYILYRQHAANVVGHSYNLKQRLKSKYKSFFLLNENPRRDNALELLNICKNNLSKKDKELIEIVAHYDKNIKNKLRFFFSSKKYGLRMSTFKLNFWLRLRILIGSV